MTLTLLIRRTILGACLLTVLTVAFTTAAADRREKIAVMKVEAPGLGKEVVSSLRDRMEVGVTRAAGTRLLVITKDSATASVGGGERLLACMEGASCDAEIGGALGVDYFVSASVRRTPLGLELGVTLLRTGRDVSLLKKDVKVFKTTGQLLEGTSEHAQAVTAAALGITNPEPATASSPIPSAAHGMVRLPGGTFTMGRGDTGTVEPFLLDVTAVMVAAYGVCVEAGKCTEPNKGGYCNWGIGERANHPVNCVDWNQATAYCAFAGKRLPTEEEREWAARGAERGTTYPWGNAEPADQLCWNGGSVQRLAKGLGTCAAGSFSAGDSPQGIKDLAGNVWEWTSSAYDPSNRVIRGGSWANKPLSSNYAAAARYRFVPRYRDSFIGFRCARDP